MSGRVNNEPLKIVIFLGSTRSNRMVDRVCTFVKSIVESKGMTPIILGKLNVLINRALNWFFMNQKFIPRS